MAGHEKANAARAAACRIGGGVARNKPGSFAKTIDAGPLSNERPKRINCGLLRGNRGLSTIVLCYGQ